MGKNGWKSQENMNNTRQNIENSLRHHEAKVPYEDWKIHICQPWRMFTSLSNQIQMTELCITECEIRLLNCMKYKLFYSMRFRSEFTSREFTHSLCSFANVPAHFNVHFLTLECNKYIIFIIHVNAFVEKRQIHHNFKIFRHEGYTKYVSNKICAVRNSTSSVENDKEIGSYRWYPYVSSWENLQWSNFWLLSKISA